MKKSWELLFYAQFGRALINNPVDAPKIIELTSIIKKISGGVLKEYLKSSTHYLAPGEEQ
jgi:hypothetical protein